MIKILIFVVPFVAAFHFIFAQEKSPDMTADEHAIKNVIASYVDTWNRHDMDAWGKLFTNDVDYVNRGGGWWKNNQENVQGHKMIHEMLVKQKQNMNYKSSVAKIMFLQTDIAIVHATWEWPDFNHPSGEVTKDFKGIITMVMVKKNNQWLIRALQNTVTSPSSKKE
jgi:uncharacterized protein (TIGR02246 family)